MDGIPTPTVECQFLEHAIELLLIPVAAIAYALVRGITVDTICTD